MTTTAPILPRLIRAELAEHCETVANLARLVEGV